MTRYYKRAVTIMDVEQLGGTMIEQLAGLFEIEVAVPLLWVPVTIGAATAQVFRNGAQASLTGKIGTLGATQVRFVFGFPFALLFLALALAIGGTGLPPVGGTALAWCALGAVAQIGATALMLVVMKARAFGVAYAYIKTEPVIVALLGVALIGDVLSPLSWLAIGVVTAGVVLSSIRARRGCCLARGG